MTVRRLELEAPPPPLWSTELAFATSVRIAPLLVPAIAPVPLGLPSPASRQHQAPAFATRTAAGVDLRLTTETVRASWPSLETSRRVLSDWAITGRIQARVEGFEPRVLRDLAVAKAQPVLKRTVPVRLMTLEQAEHWQKRLAASKRLVLRQVELLGVFPRVPIAGDAPVQYVAKEAAIAYALPPKPVPFSTIVVARHRDTGALLLGRYADED